MIINDNRRDYYDCVQRNGQDTDCRYVRKQKEIEVDFRFYPLSLEKNGYCWGGDYYNPSCVIIGFCGKIYPVIKLSDPSNPNTSEWRYSVQEVMGIIEKDPERFRIDMNLGRKKTISEGVLELEKTVKDFFNQEAPRRFFFSSPEKYRPNDLLKIFREHRVPTFIAFYKWEQGRGAFTEVVLNPILDEFGFQKIADPYQAFQQIYSYLSGVLGPELKVIPELDDVTKAEIHGFDKHSFRSDKNSRPNRKRKKKVN